jgi:hypothetical protein
MSGRAAVSAMLAARKALRRANADLLAWSENQWQQWLQARRVEQPDISKPVLVAIAYLTCLADLPVHLDLVRLLAQGSKRVALVLAFPTRSAARLARAQARADEWQDLVRIVTNEEAAQIVRRLPAEVELATFEGFGNKDRAECPEAVRALLSVDAAALPEAPTPARREEPPSRADGTGITFGPAQVRLPDAGTGTELSLRRGGVVIARQLTDLIGPGETMSIRTPTSLLTTHSQTLEIERHSPRSKPLKAVVSFHVPPSQLEPWMIGAYLNRGGAGNPVIRAFVNGIGCRISYAEDEHEVLREIPAVWGVLRGSDRILARAKAQSLYFFYIDHAYFDRGHGKTYRITRNGYEAGDVRKCPVDRLVALDLEIEPWRKSGREIIVCPPTAHFMEAHDCLDWLETTLTQLGSITDRPIIVREKPKPGERAVPLREALQTAHALVTHSSNVAIEAVCIGTPVFVAPASAAAPVGRTDLLQIEEPAYPERADWLAHLSYNQFSLDEIADGRAWRMLLDLEEREFA